MLTERDSGTLCFAFVRAAQFWLFAGLVSLAPLPFGMVHGFFQSLFAALLLLLVAGYALAALAAGAGPAVSLRRIGPEALVFSLLVIWVGLQLGSQTPAAWHHPLWAEAGAALGQEIAGAVSLTPGAGFAALMRLIMYGAVFWLALQWGRDRVRARQLLGVMVAAATLYAVYGLVVKFADLQMVLWVEKRSYLDSLTGTMVNRNSFATYLGLALLAGGGYYLYIFYRALDSGRRGRDRTLHLVHETLVRAAPQLACLLLILTALLLTNSRAGITFSLVSLLLLVLLYGPLRRVSRRGYLLIAGTVTALAILVLLFSGAGFFQRLDAADRDLETRRYVYDQVAVAIDNAPNTGHGYGSFQQLFPMYADQRTSHWDKAHNDWLETIFDLGRPAALLWFALLAGLALRCLLAVFRRRRDQLYPAVAFAACLLVALHAAVDFSLQIPGIAITFAAILGLGVAQSRSSQE